MRFVVLRPDSERPEVWSEEQVLEEFELEGGKVDLLLMTSREKIAGEGARFNIGQRIDPGFFIDHPLYPRAG